MPCDPLASCSHVDHVRLSEILASLNLRRNKRHDLRDSLPYPTLYRIGLFHLQCIYMSPSNSSSTNARNRAHPMLFVLSNQERSRESGGEVTELDATIVNIMAGYRLLSANG